MSSTRSFGIAPSELTGESLEDVFHSVNHMIPDTQTTLTVPPSESVRGAISLMRKNHISQLPVKQSSEVVGVFSYRSFATTAAKMGCEKTAFGDMPVEDFMDDLHFVRVTDGIESIFELLDRDDAVLVGERNLLQGIITASDALSFLYGIASPFVLLGEIELAIRALILGCVDDNQLAECAQNSLRSIYEPSKLPIQLEDMTFNDYTQVICHSKNWERWFRSPFGGSRERTRAKLDRIRVMRNDVFHFKRSLSVDEYQELADHRNWVLMRSRIFSNAKKQSVYP